MLGAAESPLGDREGGATAIFEKSGSPDSADPADFCNKIGPIVLQKSKIEQPQKSRESRS